jgi:hypothetical protein
MVERRGGRRSQISRTIPQKPEEKVTIDPSIAAKDYERATIIAAIDLSNSDILGRNRFTSS